MDLTVATRPEHPRLSIVVPVFNEEAAVPLFLDEMQKLQAEAGADFEFVFVNDGSSDRTSEVIRSYRGLKGAIKLVELSRNFGKDIAMSAGIDHATGDAVVPMDVDLQDPPELILTFLNHWREGYDVIYGVRDDRSSASALKRVTAEAFYRVFNAFSHSEIPPNAGDFRLLDRSVVEALRRLPERSRFMKGLFAWVGFRSKAVPYERRPRSAGTTKWNYWKLWNFALDGLVSFSSIPLRIWAYIGAIIAFLSFLYGFLIIVQVLLFGRSAPGYASLMTAVLFFGGIQLLSVGIMGEYIGRIFVEVKGRPLYIVREVYESSL